MRTDCTIDGKQVICRNASLIGFSTCRAKVGSFLVYSSGNVGHMARMLGRVRADGKTYILAMTLTCGARSAAERWIDPDEVMECFDNPPTALAEFFFAPKLPYDVNMMRRLIEHGTIQEQFVSQHAERAQEFRERDSKAWQAAHNSVRP